MKKMIIAVALAGAALAGAGTAHADDRSNYAVICAGLRGGLTPESVVRAYSNEMGYIMAEELVARAIENQCPEEG